MTLLGLSEKLAEQPRDYKDKNTIYYATAVGKSENGKVLIKSDGIVASNAEYKPVSAMLTPNNFKNGSTRLEYMPSGGQVRILVDGALLSDEEYSVNGDVVTIYALQTYEPVEVHYQSLSSFSFYGSQLVGHSIRLPFSPSDGALVYRIGDNSRESVTFTIDGDILTIPGYVIGDPSKYGIEYSVNQTFSGVPSENGDLYLPYAPTGEISVEDVSGNSLSYILNGSTLHVYVSDTVVVKWSAVYNETIGYLDFKNQRYSLAFIPDSVSMTKDGSAFSGFTVENNTIVLTAQPLEDPLYLIEGPAYYTELLDSSYFQYGHYQLKGYPETDSVTVFVNSVQTSYELVDTYLSIPSLVSSVRTIQIDYTAVLPSQYLEVPTDPSVHDGDYVMVATVNGVPTVIGVKGSGDRQDEAIADAAYAAQVAWNYADDAHTAASEAQTSAAAANYAATQAQQDADVAKDAADQAVEDAGRAYTAAQSAQTSANAANTAAQQAQADATAANTAAQQAQADATTAKNSATQANTAANSALTQLSVIEDVAGTLDWISKHGTYTLTSDTTVQEGTVYFEKVGNDYIPIAEPEGNPHAQGWYTLDVTDSQSDYIMAHLAVTSAGLWVLPSGIGSAADEQHAAGYKTLLSSTGMTIYDDTGRAVATYGEGIVFDSNRELKIGNSNTYIEYYDSNNDEIADSLRIVGAAITLASGKTVDQEITDAVGAKKSVRFKLLRDSWRDSQWATYEVAGYATSWNNIHRDSAGVETQTGYDFSTLNIGDFIIMEGVATDSKAPHTLLLKVNTAPSTATGAANCSTVSWVTGKQLATRITQTESEISLVVDDSSTSSSLVLTSQAMDYIGDHVEIKGTDGTTTVISGGQIQTGSLTIGAMSSSTQADILNSNIEIGGTNLLRRTGFPAIGDMANGYWAKWVANDTVEKTADGIKITCSGSVTAFRIPLVYEGAISVGETLTLSFDYRGDMTGVGSLYMMCNPAPNVGAAMDALVESTTNWMHFEQTFHFSGTSGGPSVQFMFPYKNQTGKWFEIKDGTLKLERGNKATDWSPAPEDYDAAIAAAQTAAAADATAKVNAANSQEQLIYCSKASGTSSLSGTTTWVTDVTGGQNKWTLKRPQYSSSYPVLFVATQRKTVGGTVTCTTPQIDDTTTVIDGGNIITGTVTANKLNAANINASGSLTIGALSSATQTDILNSNIEIGGRNLLPVSQFLKVTNAPDVIDANGWISDSTPTSDTRGWGYAASSWKVSLDAGTYTLSWQVRTSPTSSSKGICIYSSSGTLIWGSTGSSSLIGQSGSHTFALSSSTDIGIMFKIYDGVMRFKLEKGNKATDWSPAPEDAIAYTDAVVDAIEVGGTNLLQGTNKGKSNWAQASGNGSYGALEDIDGVGVRYTINTQATNYCVFQFNGSDGSAAARSIIAKGGEFTVSFDIRPSVDIPASSTAGSPFRFVDSNALNVQLEFGRPPDLPANIWTHIELTATATGTAASAQHFYWNFKAPVGTYDFKNLKLERGNKATDWSPAPEDVDAAISTAQTAANTANSRAVAYRGVCTSAYNAAAKAVTCAGFTLTNGATVSVYMSGSSNVNGALTLNVNSTGAKPIWVGDTATSDTNRLMWHAGTTITFTYDGTNWRVVDAPGNYYATECQTAAGTAKKATTIQAGVAFKGTQVEVPMKYANTASAPILAIQNTASSAAEIYGDVLYGTGSIAPTVANGYSWLAGMSVIFRYDGKYWRTGNQTIIDGGNILTGYIAADRIQSGSLTIGVLDSTSQADILNSNVHVGGTNLLKKSDNMAAWSISNATVAAGYADPDGGTGAVLVTPSATGWWLSSPAANGLLKDVGEEYSFSIWLRADNPTTCGVCFRLVKGSDPYSSTATRKVVNVTTEWQRFHVYGILQAAQTSDCCWIGQSTTEPIYAYHPKIEKGNVATAWSPSPDDLASAADSIEYIVGTQSAATGSWTGVTKETALVAGKTIAYRLPYAGSGNASLNLTLAGGGTTGAKAVYSMTTRVTTHYPANSVIQMTYDGTYWRTTGWYNTDTYNRTKYQANLVAASDITAGRIICGTSSGYRNIAASLVFDLAYPLLYAATTIAAGATSGTRDNNYLEINGITYSSNGTITSGANAKTIYLKGTVSNSQFTIAESPFMTTVAPTTEDGYAYIPLGIMTSATVGYFKSSDQLYAFQYGSFQRVDIGASLVADGAQSAADAASNAASAAQETANQVQNSVTVLSATVDDISLAVSSQGVTVKNIDAYFGFGSDGLHIKKSGASIEGVFGNSSLQFKSGSEVVMELDATTRTTKTERIQLGGYQWRVVSATELALVYTG